VLVLLTNKEQRNGQKSPKKRYHLVKKKSKSGVMTKNFLRNLINNNMTKKDL